MDTSNKLGHGTFFYKWAHLYGSEVIQKFTGDELPLRSELYSTDQMKQHGRDLAGVHQLKKSNSKDCLLARLAENEKLLLKVHNLLTDDVKADHRITPAGEWLLDNFYLIEEQIRIAKLHLPKGYSRELPHLLYGPSAGLPRVYDIALETISHGDGRVDPENLSSFVVAYQTITTLKLGELWAIPIMLRLALMENLRRVAVRIASDRTDRNYAEYWATKMLSVASSDPKSLVITIADMAKSDFPLVSSFIAEFVRRLQGQSPALALPLTWIEQRLSEADCTIEQLVRSENQQQAMDQVSISNSIGSLRFLSAMDWRDFVESISIIEQTLLQDPSGVYLTMDFATRDRYRQVVEKIAKNSPLSENDIANKAILLSQEAAINNGITDRAAHVGYFLIDDGFVKLQKLVKMHFSPIGFIQKLNHNYPSLYMLSILSVSLIFVAIMLFEVYTDGLHSWSLALWGILFLLCTSHLAVSLVNRLSSLFITPYALPRIDYSKGIPKERRTLVVIPTFLISIQGIEDLITALEVRFLANRDENLHFCLLTDFADADSETLVEDEVLLSSAQRKIEELNGKYTSDQKNSFFLFHRPRKWNNVEQLWMGNERKRGKLHDLHTFIKSGLQDNFSLIVGNTAILAEVKYIITLDTDTQLARDSAKQFIGAMAHPLNKAIFDLEKQRVVSGYGILQPRVAISIVGANRSHYASMCSSEPGIDPYTRAISDVYQDLFSEGSFIGKGIYDVSAFGQALDDCLPKNRILSHDLLEGCYARSGLLSDVPLYEEYPSNYFDDVKRRHRWIRGDWQIAQWIMPKVPRADGYLHKNPLSILSRWKIFDNLRRSLTAAALTLLLLLGWLVLSSPVYWTLSVFGIIFIPALLTSLMNIFHKPVDVTLVQHIVVSAQSVRWIFVLTVFSLACLPYEAFYSLDAVFRSIWRMTISHKHLLEWNPSSNTHTISRKSIVDYYYSMWIAPILVLIISIVLIALKPAILPFAIPVLCIWLLSPAIAWWISKPAIRSKAILSSWQTLFLQKLAHKTWAFFETFVTQEDNWLPPDNYQEHPVSIIAHRTSPTNIGLSLLANLSAYDFGIISVGKLIFRTEKTLSTMIKLERYRGHFYNWYNTLTLEPLMPLYISSVDSGNLAGHLLTLQPGLLELIEQKIINSNIFGCLSITLVILTDTASMADVPYPITRFVQLKRYLEKVKQMYPNTLIDYLHYLSQLSVLITDAVKDICMFDSNPQSELRWWAHMLAQQCNDALSELNVLTPWLAISNKCDILTELNELYDIPTLATLADLDTKLLPVISAKVNATSNTEDHYWLNEMKSLIIDACKNARERIDTINALALQCDLLSQMDYDFLYDKMRHLLAIGYNVGNCCKDSSYYDLLASEARLSCFVAIAQGKLPQESWFALGRLLTTAGGEPILLSWSGSMFEYLMPLIVMPSYDHTLLDQTYKATVARQIEYGKLRSVPWGISESGYNAIDVHLNYQYRAFGVPGLGLKRGLSEDLVIAPYASALALIVAPEDACNNLERLSKEGFETRFGFYEAIDYTPSRLPRGQSYTIVRSFMAHHQGMSLLSIAYTLLDRPMQRRFESGSLFLATLLLLQERIPKATAYYARTTELSELSIDSSILEAPIRVFTTPDTPSPEVQLLSNGSYHVMVTNSGGGYSKWKDLAVTRWREDKTCDNWGTFCYLRDVSSSEFWSIAYQPTLKRSKHYETIFSEGRAEFHDRNFDYDTHTEIAVSPEDDIELRRVRITNHSRTRRSIDITSYAEVVIAPFAADALHPAFSNLFVQTEILEHDSAILCTRRPRSENEKLPWMLHLMAVHGANVDKISFETDRVQFIGRENSTVNPIAMNYTDNCDGKLACNQGSVLDPIVSIRSRITLDHGESAIVNIVTGIHETRDGALNLIKKYQDRRLADRVFDLAWTHGQVLLRQLNASEADAQLYGRLASSIIYANALLRADTSILTNNHRGQSGLWGYAISGDLPIVLLKIEDPSNIDLVRQLVQAHAYWHIKGLAVDLVIWNEDNAGYRQLLHDQIMGLIAAGIESNVMDQPGGIFVKPAEQIAEEDRILIQTAARVIIADNRGSLADQINGHTPFDIIIPALNPNRLRLPEPLSVKPAPRNDLTFFNGLGGFTPDGREYVITTAKGQITPAPWVNVLANPYFGTVVSESGLSYTWGENAHEFRLTPWENDPIRGSQGEAFYIRDEERGHFWSPTPLPRRGTTPYTSRHGFGYSVFEHTERGILSELWVYVALGESIKYSILKIKNVSERPRHISVTGYVEWVLGDLKPKSGMHIVTEVDKTSNAILAHNPYNIDFVNRTAFFDVDDKSRTITCDRTEFIGRNGTLAAPVAMFKTHLSGKVGAALDSCTAIKVNLDLAPNQEQEVIFRLGVAQNKSEAKNLINRNQGSTVARNALNLVWQYWTHTLGAVNVQTPDTALNVLANGWLLYQTIACRLWARSATYQSGGAFGFRDQLQDVMALIYTRPELIREHLLLCANHQYVEGDVLHWWHPPLDRGIRTHCSDDYLWLPFVTCHYVLSTGDMGLLGEPVRYLQGRALNEEEDSYYDLAASSEEITSLYKHCTQAIRNGLKFGEHGLPLIGSGDWNDGMNLVGKQGKGESVWLGFFLYEVLTRFSKLALLYNDMPFSDLCIKEAKELQVNIEKHGWDKEWYLRAYFDNGSLLGSESNTECQIDSISQSWSVLSSAGSLDRTKKAMTALYKRLVHRDSKLIQLLDPPFDSSSLNPGYIKGYVPGVRENGGQYTHAAIWAAMAYAKLGDNEKAWDLFSMINPVNHTLSIEDVDIYKVEPYVMAADVYAASPHTGRGGWTWYTGSAAWMYRLIMESLLGLRLEVNKLFLNPCIPPEWEGFKLHYRYRETVYHINVIQRVTMNSELCVSVDGYIQPDNSILLFDDHIEHWVELEILVKQTTS